MADQQKVNGYFFKAFGTGVVLVIALSIVGWVSHSEIWGLVLGIGILSFIALVIGIIAAIWE